MTYFIIFLLEILVIFILSKSLIKHLGLFLYKITASPRFTQGFIWFIFLPGTIIHELSHLFAASILGIPVGRIEIFPQFEKEGIRLGSVQIGQTDPFRRLTVGLAPFVTGLAAIILILSFWDISPLSILAIFIITNTMYSSRRDLEGALAIVLAISIVGLVSYFTPLKNLVISFLNSQTVTSLFQSGVKLLIVPIVIDAAATAILALFNSFTNRPIND